MEQVEGGDLAAGPRIDLGDDTVKWRGQHRAFQRGLGRLHPGDTDRVSGSGGNAGSLFGPGSGKGLVIVGCRGGAGFD